MKKIISAIITLAMLSGMLTGIMVVNAAGNEISNIDELKNALTNGGNYVLTNNITVSENLEAAKDLTIDLNEKTIDLGSGYLAFNSTGNYKLENGTITSEIKESANGAISLTSSDAQLELSAVNVISGTIALYTTAGTVTANESSFENTVINVNGFGVITASGGAITLTNSDIKYKTNNSGSGVAGIRGTGNPVFVLNNVSILRNGVGFTQGRAITVAGSGNYVAMTINGGNFEGTNGCIYWQSNVSRPLSITDGVFTTANGTLLSSVSDSIIKITGGTFTADPQEYVDNENYVVAQNEDGTYTVTAKKEAAPTDITVNYADETLIGFADGASYIIDGNAVTLTDDNTFALADKITDAEHEISIQTAARDENHIDSDVLTVTVKARPSAPAVGDVVTVTDPTAADGQGTIVSKVSGVEYSTTSASEGFAALDSEKAVNGGATVYIRMAAVNDGEEADKRFHSETASVKVKKMSAVTLDTDGGSFVQETDNVTAYYEGDVTQLPTGLTKTGYDFNGWYVTGDATKTTVAEIGAENTGALSFTAKWTPQIYTITWQNEDGSTFATTQAEYGTIPAAPEPAPVKEDNDEYSYSFAGWTPEIAAVTGNTVYKAAFTSSKKLYEISTNSENGTIIVTSEKKTTANKDDEISFTVSADEGYKLKEDGVKVSGGGVSVAVTENNGIYSFIMPANDVIISAEFQAKEPETETVTVTFNAGDGSFVSDGQPIKTSTVTIDKGNRLTESELPTVIPPEGYTFNGWGGITENVIDADISFTAEYTIKTYIITWLNDDGETLGTTEVQHGEIPEYTGTTPTKPETDEFAYTFDKWMPNIVAATENASYTASFIAVRNDAPKVYLPLLDMFSAAMQIEKTAGEENSVLLTVSALENNTLPKLSLYAAIYEDNILKGVSCIRFIESENGEYKAALTKPAIEDGETFRIMLWTDEYKPVISVIDNTDEEFFN